MAERAKITTDKALLALNEPGKIYSDSIKGTGLYLFVTKSATRRWLFVYSRDGKRREMGLGLVDGQKGHFPQRRAQPSPFVPGDAGAGRRPLE